MPSLRQRKCDGAEVAFSDRVKALPEGVFVVGASSESERQAATTRHLVSLSKVTGGVIDRLVMRPVTRHLTRALCRTNVPSTSFTVPYVMHLYYYLGPGADIIGY